MPDFPPDDLGLSSAIGLGHHDAHFFEEPPMASHVNKDKIKKLIDKLSIKDIVDIIVEEKNVSKKEVYNYCLSLKNEN